MTNCELIGPPADRPWDFGASAPMLIVDRGVTVRADVPHVPTDPQDLVGQRRSSSTSKTTGGICSGVCYRLVADVAMGFLVSR